MKPKTLLLAAALALALTAPVLAENETAAITIDDGLITTEDAITAAVRPFDVQYSELDGTPMIIKRYELPDTVDPSLFPIGMEQGGTGYQLVEVLEQRQPATVEARTAQQIVSVSTDSDDEASILALLAPTLHHEQDGFAGVLTLDLSSIKTAVASTSSYSYATSAQREYTGLDRADVAYIPKTIQENGRTLTLADVAWTPYQTSMYTAVANYSGTATGSRASGFTTTATYSGEITKSTPGPVLYSVIYEAIPVEETRWYYSFGVTLSVTLLIVACGVFVYNRLMKHAASRTYKGRW